ncbi:hypothetical protein [Piscinibacter gummiphilus]|uniref:Uncharacterized protein n=1 Tax=Piscinibacter gummiphilus TaxID=946333 RepID=A0ABZ0CUH1_9BURK|nr:hypothetical protein [Piscinibacter gummiphilus]WOB06538.1 hypothetical protein RXV79_16585 [Piscinibacter gummiphilus]
MSANKINAISAALRKLIVASGERGVSAAEVTGHTAQMIQKASAKLLDEGVVFRGRLGHRTVRFFAKQEWATAYETTKQTAATKALSRAKARAPWPADAPIHYPKDERGNPLYKHTVVPAPERDPHMPIRTVNYQPW